MSSATAALRRFPAMSKLLFVGKWFQSDFLSIFIADFSSSHLAVLHHPSLKPEKCDGWLLHAPGATTTEMSSGDEITTRWLPSSMARSSPVSHSGSESSKIPASLPPVAPLPPDPTRNADPPWGAASQLQNGKTPSDKENDANL